MRQEKYPERLFSRPRLHWRLREKRMPGIFSPVRENALTLG
jgi:hypothetical protein